MALSDYKRKAMCMKWIELWLKVLAGIVAIFAFFLSISEFRYKTQQEFRNKQFAFCEEVTKLATEIHNTKLNKQTGTSYVTLADKFNNLVRSSDKLYGVCVERLEAAVNKMREGDQQVNGERGEFEKGEEEMQKKIAAGDKCAKNEPLHKAKEELEAATDEFANMTQDRIKSWFRGL